MKFDNDYQDPMLLLYRYTVAIKGDKDKLADDIGAGVLLRIADKTFLLSAAHCLLPNPCVIGDAGYLTIAAPPVIHPQYDGDVDFDVGFIELASLDSRALTICPTQLSCIPTTATHSYFVIGFPENVRQSKRKNGGSYDIQLYKASFVTTSPLVDNGKIVIDYPKEDKLTFPIADNLKSFTNNLKPYSTPRGFSGGGLWGIRNEPNHLFAPERDIIICGIQSHWQPSTRKVKFYPVTQWIELINATFPHLRQNLPQLA